MSNYRQLVILFLVLLLGGIGLAVWNAEQKIEKESERESTTQQVVGNNVSFTVTEGEVKKWKLDAAKAIYSEDHSEADLRYIKGAFYDAAGKPVLEFHAPTGHYTNENNAVELTGGVVAKSLQEDGGELRAPKMVWNAKTDTVVASGGINLTFAHGTSTAQTCRFSLDFSNVALQGGVVSSISPP